MSRLAAHEKPLGLAIAENATTPAPSAPGVQIWSTVASKMLEWSGTSWVDPAGGASGANVAFADFANRRIPTIVNGTPSGAAQGRATQPADFDANVRVWSAKTGITPENYGFNPVITGSPSVRSNTVPTSVANDYAAQQFGMRRIAYNSLNTAGSIASWRQGTSDVFLSNGYNYGGFFFSARFGFYAQTAIQYWFLGLAAQTTELSGDPQALSNAIGFMQGSTSGTVYAYASGTSPGVVSPRPPLGLSAASTIDRNLPLGRAYDVYIYNPRGTRTIYWALRRLGLDALPVVVHSYTYIVANEGTYLPYPQGATGGTPVPLGVHLWSSNNASAVYVGLEISHIYLEAYC